MASLWAISIVWTSLVSIDPSMIDFARPQIQKQDDEVRFQEWENSEFRLAKLDRQLDQDFSEFLGAYHQGLRISGCEFESDSYRQAGYELNFYECPSLQISGLMETRWEDDRAVQRSIEFKSPKLTDTDRENARIWISKLNGHAQWYRFNSSECQWTEPSLDDRIQTSFEKNPAHCKSETIGTSTEYRCDQNSYRFFWSKSDCENANPTKAVATTNSKISE